jgi:uncharacterized membrane protein YkvA (DUF1232 family)
MSLSKKIALAYHAFFDPRTPLLAKLILGGALVYGILPFDVVPDVLPLLGIADDAVLLLAAIMTFLRMTKAVRAELAVRTPLL